MNDKIKNYSDHPIRRLFIYQSINHPVRSIIVSLLATIVMASGLKFLVIDDDMMKMLPQNLESRKAWDSLQDEFGSTEVIFVAFGKKDRSIYEEGLTAQNKGLTSRNQLFEELWTRHFGSI